ncbi:helix-turn-helix domain-containing protein [Lacrimispora sp.]|uniref:helix-turn-helix domain-containing protein n=1 Tax=Lacrimispora sp. TaxID=2719234 RepID=UPI00289E0CF0|nr:helix-turn-helix domain-containing protein [Lacrimispora sp.]
MINKGKAYKKLYLSYGLIFLIPISMGILFYFYAYYIAKEQADASNRSLIQTVKNTCDRELEYYENILTQLALNKNVQQLSVVKGEFRSGNSYQLYTIQNEIMDLKVTINKSGDYCKDIMVYFKNCDKVVSSFGNMDFPMYSDLYCFGADDTKSAEILKKHLSEYHFRDSIPMNSKWTQGRPTLLLTMNNLKGEFGESTAMIGIWLDMDALNSSIEMASWESGLDWLIINEDNQIMNRSEDYSSIGIQYDHLNQDGDQKLRWNGEDYIIRTVFSDVFNWKYVLLMPEKMISGSAGKMRNIFVIGIFICLFTGFGAASRMMKINYNPLKVLMEVFRKHDDTQELFVDNEYLYLEEKTISLLAERSDFKQMVSRSQEVVKQYYLTDLMINSFEQSKDTPDREAIVKKFREESNLVLLITGKDASGREENQEEYIQINSLRKFIIGNVFGEGIEGSFSVEKVELGDTVAMIVNIPELSAGYDEKLEEIIDAMQKYIYENFGFMTVVLAGEAHKGLEGIHLSYMEAREAEEFVAVLDPDYISYREIKNSTHKKYDYSTDQELRIIAAIKSRNSALASSYINKILDVNFLENKASLDMLKCLLYDLMGTIMKGVQEVEEIPGEDLGLKRISVKMPLEKIKETFEGAVEKLCKSSDNSKECGQNQQLCEKLQKYIQENFSDPDLNISQTGLHFHMTPAYLSSIYKKYTGESLLKVINQTRIDEAEKLLAEGINVVEVAERVGFRDSSTFIRTFKKFTGATPGQLKNGR